MNGLGLPTMKYTDGDYRVLDRFQVIEQGAGSVELRVASCVHSSPCPF